MRQHGRKLLSIPRNAWANSMSNICRSNENIDYIVEKQNWSIKADGLQISKHIKELHSKTNFRVSYKPYLHNSRVFHFGSQFMWQNWGELLPRKSAIAVTFFHGNRDNGSLINSNINFLIDNHKNLAKIVISFSAMKERMKSWGIDDRKIIQIPIGVDLKVFNISENSDQIRNLKFFFGIPQNVKIVGSFQKDGEGWSEGSKPKYIKGPDILIQTLSRMNKEEPIFVVLSGPARGYVKEKLNAEGIPFKSFYFNDQQNLAKLYKILDLYLVTSREEGGPKGLLEALASGCPVVTTPVGMAQDVLIGSMKRNISTTFDPQELADIALLSLASSTENEEKENLRKLVENSNWEYIAKLHYNKVYLPILGERQ